MTVLHHRHHTNPVRHGVGIGELLARDPVRERVDRDREMLGGHRELEVELAYALGDQRRVRTPAASARSGRRPLDEPAGRGRHTPRTP